ncbi:putative regulatory factor Sgt1 [Usnea florida]
MDAPKDGFKWFGEGFDGFPKFLPEDCVEYTIYILDSKLTDLRRREQLREVQSAVTKQTNKLLEDYIWQRDGFKLLIEREDGRSFLRGRTNYGDSVEDEWLIVYILRELSKQFPKIWIRVIDTDGQFLLIEAANAIPGWLNPEIADFRVWLNNGKLLIIPLENRGNSIDEAEPKSLTSNEALDIVEHQTIKLLHDPAVEAEAFHRLQKYPKQILDSLHHAMLIIPRNLAYILHEDPAYISAAVEAFYIRDPIALRPLQGSNHSELLFPPTDLVVTSVKFTKVGYAQLKSQQFAAPTLWADSASTRTDANSQNRIAMGMKITCGFEMLMHDPQNQDRKDVREIGMLLEDIRFGQDALPTDDDIKLWGTREDDEAWLDINFEEFEKVLGGNGKADASKSNGGFGDKAAQENLQKMVQRFEDFLNDDAAGAGGAEFPDDMDKDDEEDGTISDENYDKGDDTDVSFDEDGFAKMMRETLGMAPTAGSPNATDNVKTRHDESGSSSDEDYNDGIHQAMQSIEGELREAGSLTLDAKAQTGNLEPQPRAIERESGRGQSKTVMEAEAISGGKETDIDFNLAKNLLESFKSQGGAPGPGGNLIGLMGMRLPRDENENGEA